MRYYANKNGGSNAEFDFSELYSILGIIEYKGEDLSDTMSAIAEMLVAEVSDKFDQEGPGWAPLSKRTLAQRRGAFAHILQDTGRLAASIRADSGPDYAEVMTDVSYAVYHVSDAPRSRLPLRDFFDLEDRVYEEASKMILEALVS